MKLTLLALTLLLVTLSSCASNVPAGTVGLGLLTGDWVIAEVGGQPVETEPGGRQPTLRFESDGKFSGFSGVNRFNGKLDKQALVEGRFELGPFVSTRMAGSPQAMELEQRIFDALEMADSCAMRDVELILFHEGDIVVHLKPGN